MNSWKLYSQRPSPSTNGRLIQLRLFKKRFELNRSFTGTPNQHKTSLIEKLPRVVQSTSPGAS